MYGSGYQVGTAPMTQANHVTKRAVSIAVEVGSSMEPQVYAGPTGKGIALRARIAMSGFDVPGVSIDFHTLKREPMMTLRE